MPSPTRSSSGLARYLQQVERFVVLDRERELELARQHRAGRRQAGELLICAHLRDVVAIARGHRGYGLPLSELIAVGNVGLVRALHRYDPDRGLRFMTYAGYWVREALTRHAMDTWSLVSMGRSSLQTRLFCGLRSRRAKLRAQGIGEAELVEVLAQHFGCSRDKIMEAQRRLDARDLSLDDGEVWAAALVEGCEDPEQHLVERQQVARRERGVAQALARLDLRERRVIEERILAERRRSLADLGRSMGITGERVRQIEQRARRKLERELTPIALV